MARRAAQSLVQQFASYAATHPDEPVVVGLFEFSGRGRGREPSVREVIPLSPADPVRAEAALATMRANGGTPIGDAMIAAKRAPRRASLRFATAAGSCWRLGMPPSSTRRSIHCLLERFWSGP